MYHENDKKNTKLLYPIGEVAEMFDVNVSLIRHWSNYFDILKPKTNKKGNRFYTSEDVENIKKIYNLVKERGIHLKDAQIYLKKNRSKIDSNIILIDKLHNVQSMLSEILLLLDDDESEPLYINKK
ncbi:MAG: MerR family transcriptional regulator [Rikenellaceae bacterium]